MTWGRARLNPVPRRRDRHAAAALSCVRHTARKEEDDIWKRSDGHESKGMKPDENHEPMRDAHELRPSEAVKGIPDGFCPASSNRVRFSYSGISTLTT
jgi:hypothetical protein